MNEEDLVAGGVKPKKSPIWAQFGPPTQILLQNPILVQTKNLKAKEKILGMMKKKIQRLAFG